jgi:hypothetical protein
VYGVGVRKRSAMRYGFGGRGVHSVGPSVRAALAASWAVAPFCSIRRPAKKPRSTSAAERPPRTPQLSSVGSRITRRPWDRAGPLSTRFPTFPSGPQRSLCADLEEGGPLGTPRPAPDGILEVSPIKRATRAARRCSRVAFGPQKMERSVKDALGRTPRGIP